MRRLDSFFGVLAIVLLSASHAGSARAGYWDVQYDLAPGSFLKAVDPLGGSDIDPITGTLTVRYDAATRSAPLSSAKLIQGHINVQVYRNVTLSVVTGHTDVNLIPPPGGTPGTLNGATLTPAVVADSSMTGYRHCYQYTAQRLRTGHWICLHAGMTHSVPQPQTPTGPGPFPQSFPKFVFTSGTAGTGDFTSTVLTQMLPTGAFTTTLYTTYVGREISRVWHAPVPSISLGGLALLAGLVLGGVAWARRCS